MSTNAIKINNLSFYYGKNLALKNISFVVKDKDFLRIMGPNGGGKSTLIKSILGLLPTRKGEIEIYGQPIKKDKTLIGYVPQISNINRLFPISVLEVVLTGFIKKKLIPFFRYSSQEKEKAFDLLKKVGLEKLADRQISELSGGEFQKLLIIRALAVSPKLLILDEPTANIDEKSKKQIYQLLDKLNNEMTILLVTHDSMAVSPNMKKSITINKEIIYSGKPK